MRFKRTERESLSVRFRLNMARIEAIVRLLFSDDIRMSFDVLGPSKGVRGDILRSVVVFLHATFEVVLRNNLPQPNKKLSFYSAADFDKALRLSKIEAAPFRRLYPPLSELAKRRKRIVHNADLDDETLSAWTIVDDWQLIMWLLAVMAFYFQYRTSIGAASDADTRQAGALQTVMKSHVVFGEQLIALPHVSPEEHFTAIREIIETLNGMVAALNLTAA